MVGRTSRVTKAPTRFQDDNDFYLVKFTEDGIKRVLSRDKVKIDAEDVETGSTCEAYWEDAQTRGWFQAIILAFGDSYENLLKAMNQKKRSQETTEPKQSKKGKQPKQHGREGEAAQSERKKSHKKTPEDDTEKKRKEQEREVKRKKKEEEKKRREAVQQQRKRQLEQLQSSLREQTTPCLTQQGFESNEDQEYPDLDEDMDSEVEEISPSLPHMASRHNSLFRSSPQNIGHSTLSPVNRSHSLIPISPTPSTDISPVNCSRSLTPTFSTPSSDISSANHSPALTPLSINYSRNRDFTPSPPAHPIRQASAIQQEFTFTPQPSAQAHKKRPHEDDGVDWSLEYRKLHKKYCMLKEKVKIMEQQSTQEEFSSENERPPPGVFNPNEAQKLKMVELHPETGVYWYIGNKNAALSSTKTAGELTAFLMDTFFTKDIMAVSNMKGGGSKGYQPLNPVIINAMRGFVLDENNYGKHAAIHFNKTVQDKCCGARRGVSKKAP